MYAQRHETEHSQLATTPLIKVEHLTGYVPIEDLTLAERGAGNGQEQD